MSCRLEAVPVVQPVSMNSSVRHFVDLKHISGLKHLFYKGWRDSSNHCKDMEKLLTVQLLASLLPNK
ncbi:hypothetical protein EXN66_Car005236 [Channa argus]|uniref:Uncharacterized protein n=1 Tax=Channa argus TaxID=215402 RepID=A0A6G1PHE5_CHAAH|nr:hypothetical protein EXN66_Car005236 [Channa argus]